MTKTMKRLTSKPINIC